MKFLLLALVFFLCGVIPASAVLVSQTEVSEPYEIVPLTTALEQRQLHIGKLENFPIMYEVVVLATTTLTAQLSQQYKRNEVPVDFALMIVREDDNGGGVSEIGRLYPADVDWEVQRNSPLGMNFLNSALIKNELRPGTYRIEVSTPLNSGRYMLSLGALEDSSGYFKMLQQAREVQRGFGLSIFSMIKSSLVYYPLGIVLLGFVLYRTWKLRNKIVHVV